MVRRLSFALPPPTMPLTASTLLHRFLDFFFPNQTSSTSNTKSLFIIRNKGYLNSLQKNKGYLNRNYLLAVYQNKIYFMIVRIKHTINYLRARRKSAVFFYKNKKTGYLNSKSSPGKENRVLYLDKRSSRPPNSHPSCLLGASCRHQARPRPKPKPVTPRLLPSL